MFHENHPGRDQQMSEDQDLHSQKFEDQEEDHVQGPFQKKDLETDSDQKSDKGQDLDHNLEQLLTNIIFPLCLIFLVLFENKEFF